MAPKRTFDVIVWGSTGFTGRLVALYLAETYADQGLKWAIAGRSSHKLVNLQAEIKEKYAVDVDYLLADSNDQQSMDSLVMKTISIISTVGPFALYGHTLVDACVRLGTNYVDSTGESIFIKEMIENHHKEAQEKGVWIVNCCGFDCIPSDLGVYHLSTQLKSLGLSAENVHMSIYDAVGGISGGTIASMMNLMAQPWPVIQDSLNPLYLVDQVDFGKPSKTPTVYYNNYLKKYEGAFAMSAINIPVVYRSFKLLKKSYGKNFVYGEGMATSNAVYAFLLSLAVGFLGGFLLFSPVRWVVKQFLPKQGQGPSQKQLDKGYFKIAITANSAKDDSLKAVVKVECGCDGGYIDTARMLAESALCFIYEKKKVGQHPAFGLIVNGGVVTPSVAFGDALITRLNRISEKTNGINFKVASQ